MPCVSQWGEDVTQELGNPIQRKNRTTSRRTWAAACLRLRVRTSARRWEKHGVWRTIALMWCLRAAFFVGVHPDRLARLYGYQPR